MNLRAMMLVLAVAALPPAFALTEAERKLLQSSMSTDAAVEMGRAADIAGLERIIGLGDPGLVGAYERGLSDSGRRKVTPPEVEAVVVRHFDDPRVGEALRALPWRYQTRALFDKYLAHAKVTHRAEDPVWGQILRTEQGGIEPAVLALMPRFPHRDKAQLNPALSYLAWRKYAGAVPLLLAEIEKSYKPGSPYNGTVELLAAFDDPEVWRRTHEEVERLRGAGRVPDQAYARSRLYLDPLMKDPDAALQVRRDSAEGAKFRAEREALQPLASAARALRGQPRAYVDAQAAYLDKVAAIAARLPSASARQQLASDYSALGLYTRFVAGDPKVAMGFFEKAAQGRDATAMIALGDTAQLALGNKAAAIRYYEAALREAHGKGASPWPFGREDTVLNAFWREWLQAETAFLKTGVPFRGSISETAITGFWEAIRFGRLPTAPAFPGWNAPMRSPPQQSSPAYSTHVLGSTPPPARWPEIANLYDAVNTSDLPARLAKLPPSRFAFYVALKQMSALKDPAAMLAEFGRHDPSGFWTTILLGTVAHHEATGRDGALQDGVADALPGMAAPARPNTLATASKRFMQARSLGPKEKK